MSLRKQILEFTRRLEDLPRRNEGYLVEFISDLKFSVKEMFGPGSQYLDYLKYVKFRPDAVFVTEKEMDRYWYSGIAQIANLLKVMLHDPLVIADSPADPGSVQEQKSPQTDLTTRMENEIRQSLVDTVQDFKRSLLYDETVFVEEGPIKEPLRRDFERNIEPPAAREAVQETKEVLQVLLVPGNDQLVNDEIAGFLRSLGVGVVDPPLSQEEGALTDRLDRFIHVDFVIVVLSADFYFYPRTQSYENVNIMGPQETVFKLGYLVAKLGRQKVVVLYQENDKFRRPTDYFDLYYISLSSTGAWKTDIVNRMKSIPERQQII